jgi:hypothetical protein
MNVVLVELCGLEASIRLELAATCESQGAKLHFSIMVNTTSRSFREKS